MIKADEYILTNIEFYRLLHSNKDTIEKQLQNSTLTSQQRIQLIQKYNEFKSQDNEYEVHSNAPIQAENPTDAVEKYLQENPQWKDRNDYEVCVISYNKKNNTYDVKPVKKNDNNNRSNPAADSSHNSLPQDQNVQTNNNGQPNDKKTEAPVDNNNMPQNPNGDGKQTYYTYQEDGQTVEVYDFTEKEQPKALTPEEKKAQEAKEKKEKEAEKKAQKEAEKKAEKEQKEEEKRKKAEEKEKLKAANKAPTTEQVQDAKEQLDQRVKTENAETSTQNSEWLKVKRNKYRDVHKLDAVQTNPANMHYVNFKQDYVVLIRKKPFYAATAQQQMQTPTDGNETPEVSLSNTVTTDTSVTQSTQNDKNSSSDTSVAQSGNSTQSGGDTEIAYKRTGTDTFTPPVLSLQILYNSKNEWVGFTWDPNKKSTDSPIIKEFKTEEDVTKDKENINKKLSEINDNYSEQRQIDIWKNSGIKNIPDDWANNSIIIAHRNHYIKAYTDYYNKRLKYAVINTKVTYNFQEGSIVIETKDDDKKEEEPNKNVQQNPVQPLKNKNGRVVESENNYLRAYQVNNFINISTNTTVHGPGTCSVTIKGAERVICVDNDSQSPNGWFSWSDLVGGLLNIDEGGTINDGTGVGTTTTSALEREKVAREEAGKPGANENSSKQAKGYNPGNDYTTGRSWKQAQETWNGVKNGPFDTDTTFRTLFKTREAKYGWRFAEKCDWEPMDEILIFGKSLTLRADDKELKDSERDDNGILLGYKHNNQAMFKMEQIFFGYIEQVTKTYDASRGSVINITAKDHLKLLELSRVNTFVGSAWAGGLTEWIPQIDWADCQYGMCRVINPIGEMAAVQQDGSMTPAHTVPEQNKPSYSSYNEKLSGSAYVMGHNWAGWYPDEIVQVLSLQAGIPEKFIKKRVEPFHQFVPFLMDTNGQQMDIFKGGNETAYSICQKAAQKLMLEFFADEEGHIVLKIPNWVLGVNLLWMNNCNIHYKEFKRNEKLPEFDVTVDKQSGMPTIHVKTENSNSGSGDGSGGGLVGGLLNMINSALQNVAGKFLDKLPSGIIANNLNPDKIGVVWQKPEKCGNTPIKKDDTGGGSEDIIHSLGFEDNLVYAALTQNTIDDILDETIPSVKQINDHTILIKTGRWFESKIGSLYNLAKRYYGNGRKWRLIADTNDIKDPTELVPGQIIKVVFDDAISDYINISNISNDIIDTNEKIVHSNEYEVHSNIAIEANDKDEALAKLKKENPQFDTGEWQFTISYNEISKKYNITPFKNDDNSKNKNPAGDNNSQKDEQAVPVKDTNQSKKNGEGDKSSQPTDGKTNNNEVDTTNSKTKNGTVTPEAKSIEKKETGTGEQSSDTPVASTQQDQPTDKNADRKTRAQKKAEKEKLAKETREAKQKQEEEEEKQYRQALSESIKNNLNARNQAIGDRVGGRTDMDIPVLKAEYIISFSLMDSDQDIYNFITVSGTNNFRLGEGEKWSGRAIPLWDHILQFGLRAHPAMEANVLCGDPAMCQLMGAMLCYKSLANRYKAVVTAIDDSAIKVGNPIRLHMYDEHPFRNASYIMPDVKDPSKMQENPEKTTVESVDSGTSTTSTFDNYAFVNDLADHGSETVINFDNFAFVSSFIHNAKTNTYTIEQHTVDDLPDEDYSQADDATIEKAKKEWQDDHASKLQFALQALNAGNINQEIYDKCLASLNDAYPKIIDQIKIGIILKVDQNEGVITVTTKGHTDKEIKLDSSGLQTSLDLTKAEDSTVNEIKSTTQSNHEFMLNKLSELRGPSAETSSISEETYNKAVQSINNTFETIQKYIVKGNKLTIDYNSGKINLEIQASGQANTNTQTVNANDPNANKTDQTKTDSEIVDAAKKATPPADDGYEAPIFDENIFPEQACFYIESMSRNIDVQNVSTMTLQLRAGRMMGQSSCYDIMSFFYNLYYRPWQTHGYYEDHGGNDTALLNPHYDDGQYEKSLHAAYLTAEQLKSAEKQEERDRNEEEAKKRQEEGIKKITEHGDNAAGRATPKDESEKSGTDGKDTTQGGGASTQSGGDDGAQADPNKEKDPKDDSSGTNTNPNNPTEKPEDKKVNPQEVSENIQLYNNEIEIRKNENTKWGNEITEREKAINNIRTMSNQMYYDNYVAMNKGAASYQFSDSLAESWKSRAIQVNEQQINALKAKIEQNNNDIQKFNQYITEEQSKLS